MATGDSFLSSFDLFFSIISVNINVKVLPDSNRITPHLLVLLQSFTTFNPPVFSGWISQPCSNNVSNSLTPKE
jgi:hypothetical protein